MADKLYIPAMTDEAITMLNDVADELQENNGKLSPDFIEKKGKEADTEYAKVGDSVRICVLILPTGHKFVGKAMVLDPANDNEAIGNGVAYNDAVEQLWQHFGGLAKLLK